LRSKFQIILISLYSMEAGKTESGDWCKIKALLLDSDGVLTDGGVYLPEEGGSEMRRFNIKDGFGITRLLHTGTPVGVISRSPSTPVKTRCERLGIPYVFLGVQDKVECANELISSLGLEWCDIAFMGDDVPDLPLIKRVGVSMAPNDAATEVLKEAQWISNYPGGNGAVREACDRIYWAKKRISIS